VYGLDKKSSVDRRENTREMVLPHAHCRMHLLVASALVAACVSVPPLWVPRCGARGRGDWLEVRLGARRLSLRGGHGSGPSEASDRQETPAKGFSGQVTLPAGSKSLPHIVQHVSGQLCLKCQAEILKCLCLMFFTSEARALTFSEFLPVARRQQLGQRCCYRRPI
jgi:hypothetical protein